MGSRAVALVCRDLAAAAQARFGAPGDDAGAVWTRTGRPFFARAADRRAGRAAARRGRGGRPVRRARTRPGCCWTPNCCRGAPRPGSCCATSTPRSGAAARAALPAAVEVLEQAAAAGLDVAGLLERTRARERQRRGIHRRLPALLLADRRAGGSPDRSVPAARHRGRGASLAAARLAPGRRRPAGRGRPRSCRAHPPHRCRTRPTRASVGSGHRLVVRS